MPDMKYEEEQQKLDAQEGIYPSLIAGCDEAGRGPLAGPLVAAAVILPEHPDLPEITDSKKINKKHHRAYAEHVLREAKAVGIGVASVEYIDRFGIGMANRYAIEQAVANLPVKPTRLLIDGSNQQRIHTKIPQTQSIHDALMEEYAREYPQYGWLKNAGYGTPDHLAAIEAYGICEYHRKCFKPIKEYLKRKEHQVA